MSILIFLVWLVFYEILFGFFKKAINSKIQEDKKIQLYPKLIWYNVFAAQAAYSTISLSLCQ
jgi:hypothetical protein